MRGITSRGHSLIKILGILTIALVMLSGAAGASYSYMNINIQGTAQDGYQVNFVIPWKSGMSSDFSNIRFFANNRSTNMNLALPYWIESQTNGESANVWIPLPANCNKIVCEWNLPEETESESNGYLVFPNLFDDFSGTSINTTIWGGSFSGVSVSNGICTVTGEEGDQIQSKSPTAILEYTTTDFRVKPTHYADPSYGECICLAGFADGYHRRIDVFFDSGVGYGWFTHNGLDGNGVYTKVGDLPGYAPNTWVKLSFSRRGTSGAYSTNGVEQLLSAEQYFNMGTNSPFIVSSYTRPDSRIDIDYVFNHMYSAVPPIITVDSTAQEQPEEQKQPTEEAQSAEQKKPISTENTQSSSASVSLHGEKTKVVEGEDILLKLSAVNLITKPTMHIQAIIIPPSGMSVSSSEFVESGAGQYTTTYDIEPGKGRDIEVRIEANQVGDFNVTGRVVYYFGNNKKDGGDYTLYLPIQVTDPNTQPTADKPVTISVIPELGVPSILFILMSVFIIRKIPR